MLGMRATNVLCVGVLTHNRIHRTQSCMAGFLYHRCSQRTRSICLEKDLAYSTSPVPRFCTCIIQPFELN